MVEKVSNIKKYRQKAMSITGAQIPAKKQRHIQAKQDTESMENTTTSCNQTINLVSKE